MNTRPGITTTVIAGALTAALACFATALAQNPFPEAPGRDTVMLACSQCHSIGKIVQADLSSGDWQFIVYDMIARGSPVHADEIVTLTRYLQDNFANDRN